VLLMVLQLV